MQIEVRAAEGGDHAKSIAERLAGVYERYLAAHG